MRGGAGAEKGGGGAAKGGGRRRERANHSGSLSVDHLASASDVVEHSPLPDPEGREKERDRDSAVSLGLASQLSLPAKSPARAGSLPLPIPVMTRNQHLKTLAAKYDAKNPAPSSTQHSLAQDKADLKVLEKEESILLARKAALLDAGRRPTQLTDALALFGFNVGAVSRLPVQHRPQAHVQAAGSTEPHPCFETHLRVALLRGTPLPTLPALAALIRASDVYINREMDDAAYEFELMLEDAAQPSSLPNALSDLNLSSSPASTSSTTRASAFSSNANKGPLDDPKYVADLELVKCAMAADALHSYSFCLERMLHVDDAWHCAECCTCRDLDLTPDVWHCTKCNDCVEETPCPKCLPCVCGGIS
ncbi:hypothetical protein BC830DRAFT_817430 [Chytriomyces sp. MP71]|nr:hypothetical protein BC830DRAFT_817430 [Chytriomyces sp. MP71]